MDSIELLYINFREHAYLSGLEINFSQEIGFTLKENNELEIYKIDSKNIFGETITNLSVIVGKNGVGKTTIINTIYDSLHGSVRKDLLIVLKKDHEIVVYCEDNYITINYNKAKALFNEYLFRIQKDGFILDVVPFSEREQDYVQEAISVVYISDFIDSSINSSSHIFENNHGLNYSPVALINSPGSFLEYPGTINNNIKQTTTNFKIISTIHQIQFLEKDSGFFDFPTPDTVEICFFNLLLRYKKYFANTPLSIGRFENVNELVNNIIERYEENKWKSILDFHLFFAIINIMDFSQYAIDTENAEKHIGKKNITQNEIDKIRNENLSIYYKRTKNLLNEFSQNNKSIMQLEDGIIELIKTTGVMNFYSSIQDDEELSIIQDIKVVIQAYRNLFDFKKYDLNKIESNIKLELKFASLFLKNYLTLRNKVNFKNQYNACMPDVIRYFKGKNEFYFSSGQDSILRIFTYINLAIMNLKKLSKNKYISLIILLDEPNNSLHPEMQKQFIKLINDFLNSKPYGKCKFHVIMTTHSPIVISDLTSNHVIFLEDYCDKGKRKIRSLDNDAKPKTFAQNIYNLYKESFFIQNGLIGSFSDDILSDIYKQISNNKKIEQNNLNNEYKFSSDKIKFIINEIGEPLIKQQFIERFESENKKLLLENIAQNSELKPEIKKQIVDLILKNGGK